MGNIIFSGQIKSNSNITYKIDLFSENYNGLPIVDIIGGTGNTFYIDNDWTGYLQNGMDVDLITATLTTTATVTSFSYNSASNRTEIVLDTSYSASYLTINANNYAPTFDPRIYDIETAWDSEGDIIVESIKASSTTITYANPKDYSYFDRFIEMYIASNDNELKLIIYRDNSGWELDWVGNIVIDLVEWDNISKPTPFTIKAIDGLDKLKDISYDEVTTTPTETSLKEHIYNLLSKNDLNQFWGTNDAYLRESIEYVSNEVAGTVTDSVSPLDYCFISDRMFVNKRPDDNTSEGISCYEALRGILELFNCRIFLSKGVYYIQQVRNYDNTTVIVYREYAKTMGTYARGTYNYKLTAGGRDRAEDLVVLGGGKFAYLAGLYKVTMDVKANLQSEVKLTHLQCESGVNPDTFTETFDVFGGVGTGAFLKLDFEVSLLPFISVGDYLYLKVEMYGTAGGTTYYLSGGLGSVKQWVTTPYTKLWYDYKIQGLAVGATQKFTLETPEIPFDGTLTLVLTASHKNFSGTTITIGGGSNQSFGVSSKITLPLGESSNNSLIESYNPTLNYTKELKIPSLVITDWSNNTSINVISVKEDYLTTNTKLVKTLTWDAGLDTDDTLTATRVAEALSLQYRPISRYLGSFEGDYYPENTILYDNKNYFFNGFVKRYKMDEVDGEWIEQSNRRSGIVPIDYTGDLGEGEIYTGDGNQSGMVALLNNNHTVSTVDSAQAAGAVTSLSIVASGLSSSILKGDKVLVIDPITNGVIEEFIAASDLLSSDTTLQVEAKTTAQDIEAGMVFQVAKDTIFEKLNMASTDYMMRVAAGDVAGASAVNVHGMNLDSANGTTEDIWDGGGTYPYPTTAAITTISTASNSAPLQGADVEVIGLDTNWDIVTETVTLDAGDTTTLTPITTALKRVFSIRLLENVVAAVDIKLTDVSGITTYCIITAGFNKSQMAMYTIPSGYTGYITNWSADYAKSVSKNPYSVEYGIWFADRENGYEFYLSQKAGIQDGAGPMQHIVQPYKKVTEKTDIKITSNANGAAAHVHAGFDLVLVENA